MNLIPVQVQKDGGSEGGAFIKATFTYKVHSLSGALLGEHVPMVGARQGLRTIPGGGVGIAFYDAEGNLKLIEAGETYGQSACEDL